MPNIYNKKTAAKFLGISTETLDRQKRAGKLPYRQIGDRIVFMESDLLAFLDACAVPATAVPTDREKLNMAKAIREAV
jgi:predicted site-specific integrase-resolvase